MAITIDYTPMGAVGKAAIMAGQGQAAAEQQARSLELYRIRSQQQYGMEMMRMQTQAAQLSRQEQFEYNRALFMQKAQVDMQMEVGDYARKKQKLNAVLDQINESDEFTAQQKETLAIQAMAKYADVGRGITDLQGEAGGMTAGMQTTLQKGQYFTQVYNAAMEAVRSGQATLPQAQQQMRAIGAPESMVKQMDRQEVMENEAKKRIIELQRVRDVMMKEFVVRRGAVHQVLRKKPGGRMELSKLKEGSPELARYQTLLTEQQRLTENLRDLQSRSDFEQAMSIDENLQQAVAEAGYEAVYKYWMMKKTQTQAPQEEEAGFVNWIKGGKLW